MREENYEKYKCFEQIFEETQKLEERKQRIRDEKISHHELERFVEFAYPIKKEDGKKFLLELRTKEQSHAKEPPHVHLWSSDKNKEVSMFITDEIPQTIHDLRFDKKTISNMPDTGVLDDLVKWAKAPFSKNKTSAPTGWDYLKGQYEIMQPEASKEIHYASKNDLEDISY